MRRLSIFWIYFIGFLSVGITNANEEGKNTNFCVDEQNSGEKLLCLPAEDKGHRPDIWNVRESQMEAVLGEHQGRLQKRETVSYVEEVSQNYVSSNTDYNNAVEGNVDIMSSENMKEKGNIGSNQTNGLHETHAMNEENVRGEGAIDGNIKLQAFKSPLNNHDDKLRTQYEDLKNNVVEASKDTYTRAMNFPPSTLEAATQETSGDNVDKARGRFQVDEKNVNVAHELRASVTDVRSHKEFKTFIENDGNSDALRVVFYYDQGASDDEIQTSFLKLYDKASPLFSPYDIRLAKVECSSVHHSRQCSDSRRARFCFGYRGGLQKIAFPLHTVATEDALVASVLHFAALDRVPIIQSAPELRAVQQRCLARCNIFVSQIKTLGSAHHRAVLEAAMSVSPRPLTPPQKSLVFAVVTSAQAVASLPAVTGWQGAWLLQCDAELPCTASPYRGPVSRRHLLQFVRFLRLPLWVKLGKETDNYFYDTTFQKSHTNNQKDFSSPNDENWQNKDFNKMRNAHVGSEASSSPANPEPQFSAASHHFGHDASHHFTNGTTSSLANTTELMQTFLHSGMSLVLLLTDAATEERVGLLAPQLARLLRGAASLVVVFMERIPASVLRRLEVPSLTTPAMMFFPPFQMAPSAHVVNFEDPLEWVEEQLSRLQPQSSYDSTEGYSPLPHIEELQQDDEVVLSMVTEGSLRDVPRLRGEEDLRRRTRESNTLMAVAYGYSWDASTNVLAQHLSELPASLASLDSRATVHRMDCYDSPAACANLSHVPALVFHLRDESLIYGGPLYAAAILKSILILETAWPAVSIPEESVPAFLNLTLFTSLNEVVSTAVLGVFTQERDARDYIQAAEVFRQDILFGIFYATADSAQKWCRDPSLPLASNCIVIAKKDQFQKRVILRGTLANSTEIIKQLEQEMLQPHRLMGFLTSSRESRKKSAYLVLLLVRDENVGVVADDKFSAFSEVQQKNRKESYVFKKDVNSNLRKFQQREIDICTEKEGTLGPMKNSVLEKEETETLQARCKLLDRLKFGDTTEETDVLYGSKLFKTVGHVAAKLASDDLMFSWIPRNSSLADAALPAWRCPQAALLVGLDLISSKVFCGGTFRSEAAVLGWVRDLMSAKLTQTELLRPSRWRPLLHGLDYLRLLEEEAEEGSKFQA